VSLQFNAEDRGGQRVLVLNPAKTGLVPAPIIEVCPNRDFILVLRIGKHRVLVTEQDCICTPGGEFSSCRSYADFMDLTGLSAEKVISEARVQWNRMK
jgi:hypothetical protein